MNKEDFTLLVVDYRTMVRGAIIKAVPSISYDMDLDDLEQETWLKAWEHRDQYDPARGAVQTWLFRIAHSVAVDWLRAQQAAKRPDLAFRGDGEMATHGGAYTEYYDAPLADCEFGSDALPPHYPSAEQEYEAQERALALDEEFCKLPEREQAILHMAYEEDMSAQEIAERLGLGYGNVRRIMGEARKRLLAKG
jgi:RNA polymerase sigma-70 factor (ECF subfamily)